MDPEAPKISTNIFCDTCGAPGIKPKTVLYGRNLPDEYFEGTHADFPDEVDLLIVAGTSLTVGPANTIVTMVRLSRT